MRSAHACAALAAALLLSGCDDDATVALVNGTLRVVAYNPGETAATVVVTVRATAAEQLVRAGVQPQLTEVRVELEPARYDVRVHSLDAAEELLASVWVTGVVILRGQTTDVEVDLSTGRPPPGEICDNVDNDHDSLTDEQDELVVCAECVGRMERAAADDPRCGNIRCSSLDRTELRGTNTAASDAKSCVKRAHTDLTSNRCADIGKCISLPADAARCQATEQVLATAGLCRTIAACDTGSPRVETAPDGTPCGPERTCQGGECRGAGPDPGCADGTREGFQSLTAHAGIAGCSGAWSVPGVTRDDLVPTCGRAAGNDGTNREGTGCSAADLCAAGWHVCRGRLEVAQKSPGGCGDAVPPGTPDKALFFAVAQRSEMNTVCTDTSGDNDVFGCGNLGIQLQAQKGCEPLTRALASMQAGSCGFNEAEPGLGPWQCPGANRGDLHEGANVTKKGCPNGSCSYDGRPVGNSDKGGVLCCRD